MRQVAKVAVVDQQGEVLFIQRSMQDTNPGQWETPGGGVDEGETPMQAAIREVNEEAGILLDKVYPRGSATLKDDETGEEFKVHFFRAWKLLGQKASVENNPDHDAFMWRKVDAGLLASVDSWTRYQLTNGM